MKVTSKKYTGLDDDVAYEAFIYCNDKLVCITPKQGLNDQKHVVKTTLLVSTRIQCICLRFMVFKTASIYAGNCGRQSYEYKSLL